jgi:hypothetical protein
LQPLFAPPPSSPPVDRPRPRPRPHLDALRTEAILFSRYLVGADPPEELITRYAEADAILFEAPASAADRKILAFARAHPWSIALFDARTCVSPGSRFRRKLLVMMAILETTPRFVAQTSPAPAGLGALVVRAGAAGVATLASFIAGLALTLVVTGAATREAPA